MILQLHPYEAVTIYSAVHAALIRLIAISTTQRYETFRDELSVDGAARQVAALVNSHKLLENVFGDERSEYDPFFAIPQAIIDFGKTLATATTWADVPLHDQDLCNDVNCVWCDCLNESLL